MGRYLGLKIWPVGVQLLLLSLLPQTIGGAVMAPPWANPKLNPCAMQPRGWQLLFWPPDGRCYKIFQMGYPCPDDMELSPASGKSGKNLSAECRCPPKTAQSTTDGKCYELFTLGPCEVGHYFGPDHIHKSDVSKRQWGTCKQLKVCSNKSLIYWPKDSQCYQILSRGPCPKGQLLITNPNTTIPFCTCGDRKELKDYRYANGHCYQHFTRGPCWEKGQLFLPDRSCGCHENLPHYHEETQRCFELDTKGPCDIGQLFQLNPQTGRAECSCKSGYIQYQNSTACYRPFTQGPCDKNHILLNSSACLMQPCERGHLYFPARGRCYRIGSKEPCFKNQVFTFDFSTRPSIDGISYNGMCTCERKNCDSELAAALVCDRNRGLIKYKNECHKMYTQGPCFRGSWLVPQREGKHELYSEGTRERTGLCECIPGYARSVRTIGQKSVTICLSPAMVAADYMNRNYTTTRVINVG